MFSWSSSSFTCYSFSFAESFISPTLKCWQTSGLGPQALTLRYWWVHPISVHWRLTNLFLQPELSTLNPRLIYPTDVSISPLRCLIRGSSLSCLNLIPRLPSVKPAPQSFPFQAMATPAYHQPWCHLWLLSFAHTPNWFHWQILLTPDLTTFHTSTTNNLVQANLICPELL